MSATDRDLIFHLLDLQSRDVRIEAETDEMREIAYEAPASDEEEDDEEFQSKQRKRRSGPSSQGGVRREFMVHLFGVTEQGRPIRCDVTGFRPSFFLRLPQEKTNQAIDSIKGYIRQQGISMGELTFRKVERKIFYGFTAETPYPFLEIEVPSLSLFRNLRNLFLDDQLHYMTRRPLEEPLKGKPIEVYEANIDPMLRFLHVQNIQPCNWVRIKNGMNSIAEDGNQGIVVDCDYEEVAPTVGPRPCAPFLTASWDIECFSMTGDFPLARRTWTKAAKELYGLCQNASDVLPTVLKSLSVGQNPVATLPKGMTPIYCSLKRSLSAIEEEFKKPKYETEWNAIFECKKHDTDETMLERFERCLERQCKSHVILQGDPVIQIGTTLTRGTVETTERHLFVFPDCAPIPGIVIHAFSSEKEMILGWFSWMMERNPDILIGYNVFGFDEAYLWHRAEELSLITPNSPITAFTRLFELSSEMKLEEKFLSSSAMGDNRMYIWTTHGRLQIDMFHYIKRNFTLPSYKLDEVTKHFMSGKLAGYEYDEKTQLLTLKVEGAVKDMKIGRSITLLDETGETVSPKLTVQSIQKGELIVDCSAISLDSLETMWSEIEDATKWVVVKDDVSPQDIFRLHRGSAEERAIVGKYCLQDCDLVIDLYKKLETFNNSMSMANVCSVPVTYIFVRGQGIKIESLIFKFCREKGVVIPVLPVPKQGGGDDSYEGAIVLDPEPGFYSTSTIGVCDFASLYPSTIVSENISHDSLLWVKDFREDGELICHQWGSEDFDDWKGYAYTDIEYDIIRPDPEDHRKMPRKIKCGRRICRYAQPLDGSKSTLPQITTWLLKARSAKKKEMGKEADPERKALLDAEQLAYKLTGNSLYGQLGSGTFKIRLQALAASVTAYGRKQILFAKAAIEKFYGPEAKDPRCSARCMAKVVYGDSVTGDTPVVLRNDRTNEIFMKRIDELYSEEKWGAYHETKEYINMTTESISIWTDKGFTSVRKLIRHKLHPHKKLFRIHTHTGVVDATEDHSLVLKDGTEVKPDQVALGTELLHNDSLYKELDESPTTGAFTEDEAFVMGLFVADGSADVYDCPSGKKATWAINKADIGLLVTAQKKCPFETKIINTIESSGAFKLVPVGDHVTPASMYREMFYNNHREKKIPDSILNASLSIVEAFWNGFYSGDGDKDNNGYIRFDQKGKEIGAGLYLLARRLGYSVSINDRVSKQDVFRYTMTKENQRKNPIVIKKIRELEHPGEAYVYDFETSNHHFGVGPGALIVHNTDSLFVEFNMKNPETGELLTGLEGRKATMAMTDEAGHFITKCLAPPHDFEFDKAFDPLLMFSKKRYAGNMYEDQEKPEKYVHKYMGIALKRRDNAPIVKTIFGGAMKMLLDKRDVEGAFELVKKKCMELVSGEVSLSQLTVTKSLRADYADPSRIAHKALADRITARDPGNAPAAGDRIGYVYIMPKAGQLASKLQGDRIETPQYIREHQLQPDYKHYIEHQLQNPISQAFGLLLERIPGYHPEMMKGCPSIQEDLDRYLTHRENKAAELLFAESLKQIDRINQRHAMAGMFGGKAVISSSSAASSTTSSTASKKSTLADRPPMIGKNTVQQTMSSFLLDSMLVNEIKKKDRANAKKKAEEKEQKESKQSKSK